MIAAGEENFKVVSQESCPLFSLDVCPAFWTQQQLVASLEEFLQCAQELQPVALFHTMEGSQEARNQGPSCETRYISLGNEAPETL